MVEFCQASLSQAYKPIPTFVSPLFVFFQPRPFLDSSVCPIPSMPFILSLHSCQNHLSKEELSLPTGAPRWLLIVYCRESNLVLQCHRWEPRVPAVWSSTVGMLLFSQGAVATSAEHCRINVAPLCVPALLLRKISLEMEPQPGSLQPLAAGRLHPCCNS